MFSRSVSEYWCLIVTPPVSKSHHDCVESAVSSPERRRAACRFGMGMHGGHGVGQAISIVRTLSGKDSV